MDNKPITITGVVLDINEHKGTWDVPRDPPSYGLAVRSDTDKGLGGRRDTLWEVWASGAAAEHIAAEAVKVGDVVSVTGTTEHPYRYDYGIDDLELEIRAEAVALLERDDGTRAAKIEGPTFSPEEWAAIEEEQEAYYEAVMQAHAAYSEADDAYWEARHAGDEALVADAKAKRLKATRDLVERLGPDTAMECSRGIPIAFPWPDVDEINAVSGPELSI